MSTFINQNSIGRLVGRKSIDLITAPRSIISIRGLLDPNLLIRSTLWNLRGGILILIGFCFCHLVHSHLFGYLSFARIRVGPCFLTTIVLLLGLTLVNTQVSRTIVEGVMITLTSCIEKNTTLTL